MKTLLWFQGGGPLGSFGVGAWRRIAPWLRRRGDPLVAIGGGSIGALNAAWLCPRLGESDQGADGLEQLWRHTIATPSWPFAGWAWGETPHARRVRGWNGFLTGLLVGNGLYGPSLAAWTPWGLAERWHSPLFERERMERLLHRDAPAYRSDTTSDVLLAVATSAVQDGALQLHDSDRGPVEARHVLASSALPMLFSPVEVDGAWQWDGDLVRDSPLPAFVDAVRRSGRAGPAETLRLITVEQLPRAAPDLPRSGPEMLYRAITLAQADRLADDADAHVQRLRIVRMPQSGDGVSGLLDHSPERVDTLIAEGDAAAADALEAASAPGRRAVRA